MPCSVNILDPLDPVSARERVRRGISSDAAIKPAPPPAAPLRGSQFSIKTMLYVTAGCAALFSVLRLLGLEAWGFFFGFLIMGLVARLAILCIETSWAVKRKRPTPKMHPSRLCKPQGHAISAAAIVVMWLIWIGFLAAVWAL